VLNNILIIGASGFIGHYILTHFSEKFQCKGISRKDKVDISDYSTLQNIDFSPEIIIHAAAYLGADMEESFKTNVLGTFNICKYAKDKGVKHVVLLSSISIYENAKNEYFNNYAKSKKHAEDIAINYCKEHNIQLTVLRLGQVYDEQGVGERSQKMLYSFIDTIKKHNKISIYGKKNPIRNFINIKDVLLVLENVLIKKQYGIFDIINEKSHTISEIAYMIFDILKISPKIEYLENEKDIPSIYVPPCNYELEKPFIALYDGILGILANDG